MLPVESPSEADELRLEPVGDVSSGLRLSRPSYLATAVILQYFSVVIYSSTSSVPSFSAVPTTSNKYVRVQDLMNSLRASTRATHSILGPTCPVDFSSKRVGK